MKIFTARWPHKTKNWKIETKIPNRSRANTHTDNILINKNISTV
jgi:hypothetical protein